MERPDSSTRAGVDNRDAASQYRRMEDRMTALEKTVAVMQADIAAIRSNYATREDVAGLKAAVFKAINAQTWHFVAWVTAVMGLYSAALYFIVRNVH